MCNSLNTVFLLSKHLLIFSHEKSNGIVLLVLFMMLDVLVFTVFTLFTEPREGKAWSKRLGEDSRSHRNYRHIYSLLAGTAAIHSLSPG